MRVVLACLVCLSLPAACGSPEPETFDATVTFSVLGGLPSSDGLVTSKRAVTYLDLGKPGRTSIVDAWQEDAAPDTRYGRHRFPAHTGAGAFAAYYVGVLANAGWDAESDYAFDEASATLRFFGLQRIGAGADSDEVRVTVERVPGAVP